jgi:hypothetical protein
MSLRTFHLVFVTLCTIGLLAFGIWGVRSYRARGETLDLVLGVIGFVCTPLLLWYGRWFLRKIDKAKLT